MDKKLKVKWLKALRGGRYKQANGQLREDGAYCCLGVLAQIQGAKWEDDLTPKIVGCEAFAANGDGKIGYLRPMFAGGLRKSVQATLASLNDSGKSFKEIADYIEKRL